MINKKRMINDNEYYLLGFDLNISLDKIYNV